MRPTAGASAPRVPALSPAERERLRALIKAHCGLRPDDAKLAFGLERVWPGLGAEAPASAGALLAALQDPDGPLWARLLPCLTINETYFLREPRQLQDFVELAVPGLRRRAAARGEARVRVLSAACATGEEPYSLAMLLADAGCRARVLGVDVDVEALARAQAGLYGPNAFRGCDPAWRDGRFDPAGERCWSVKPAFREAVAFQRVNLLEAARALAGRRFDAIFCRNVLIYFDRATQLEVIGQLRGLLVPGGCLFLGHSEIFAGVDLGLRVHSTARATTYQLPEDA